MKLSSLLLLCCLISLHSSCQRYTVDKLPELQIHFGEGGGFTGAITEYCLLKNGQIFTKKHFTHDFKSFKKVKRRTAKKCFKICKKIEIEKIQLNNPGDKYYFIVYQTKDKTHKVAWGTNKKEVPKEIKELYTSLKALLKKENRRNINKKKNK